MSSRNASSLLVQRDVRFSRTGARDLTLAYDLLLGIVSCASGQSHSIVFADDVSLVRPSAASVLIGAATADLSCSR